MMSRNKYRFQMIGLFIILASAITSCNFPGGDQAQTPDLSSDCTPVLPQIEGDGEPYQTVLEPFDLLAPSGNRIFGYILRPDPDIYPDLCFPAIVLVPGGINPGRMEVAKGDEAHMLSKAGMVVVGFNAEGRGSDLPEDIYSEGTEDYNGFRQQDGL